MREIERAKPTLEEAEEAVKVMLRYIGEDPGREGLQQTPSRVVRSWAKLYGGYRQDPKEIMKASFGEVDRYDQMILLGPIEFFSMCEHHLLPFHGQVVIGYLPGEDNRVVGVSKLARCVEVFARRAQIQERMTEQIAQSVKSQSGAKGVGVIVRAQHLCMVARGVEKQNALMTTSSMLGDFRVSATAKAEFMSFAKQTEL